MSNQNLFNAHEIKQLELLFKKAWMMIAADLVTPTGMIQREDLFSFIIDADILRGLEENEEEEKILRKFLNLPYEWKRDYIENIFPFEVYECQKRRPKSNF